MKIIPLKDNTANNNVKLEESGVDILYYLKRCTYFKVKITFKNM